MALDQLYEEIKRKRHMGIIKDYIALPFVLLGSLFYLIGEKISGKKFSRRADMVKAEIMVDEIKGMNRHDRRSLKHKIKG